MPATMPRDVDTFLRRHGFKIHGRPAPAVGPVTWERFSRRGGVGVRRVYTQDAAVFIALQEPEPSIVQSVEKVPGK